VIENTRKRDHMGCISIDERIILKLIFKEYGGCWWWLMVGCFKRGIEFTSFTQCKEFLD
jgi:hypothetical protein